MQIYNRKLRRNPRRTSAKSTILSNLRTQPFSERGDSDPCQAMF